VATVLVTGASGRLGTKTVRVLEEAGHDPRPFARRAGSDLVSGEGLAEALDGVTRVLHAASDSHTRDGADDLDATRNLLAAAAAGVEHVLYVSIVGVDRIPYRYYRNKLACEQLVAASGIPFTILRATQFHELGEGVLREKERRWLSLIYPFDFKVQLVAAQEVAMRAVQLLAGPPQQAVVEFGGPEVLTVREAVDTWRDLRGPLRVLPLPYPGKVARAFREGLATTDRAEGRQTWREYVSPLD
jgi:uncharacterized protein YbjT (DUF2867 family)